MIKVNLGRLAYIYQMGKVHFPLYDILLEKRDPGASLTENEKKTFLTAVKKLNVEEYNIIYLLIKIFYINNQDSPYVLLPYGGKQLKTGVRFDFTTLPSELQWMLYEFVRLHLEKNNL
jgi:hypothetical protein